MKIFLCLITLLGGCMTPDRPYIQIKSDDQELLEKGLEGVEIWSNLGFSASTEASGLNECDTYWQDSWGDCRVTVTIVAETDPKDLDGYSALGFTDASHRKITTSSSLSGDHLLHNLAHELGHVLITDYHLTRPGQSGIMWYDAYQSGWPIVASIDDYKLACDEASLCYRP
jgi:hypothetical protein